MIQQFDAVEYLKDNDRRFQAIPTMVISGWGLGGLIIVGSVMITGFGVLLVQDELYPPIVTLGWVMVVFGFVIMVEAAETRQKYIKPFIDWDEYFARTLD